MATVSLRFAALPAHVRTARLVAAAVARRAGVADEVLDEIRLAVDEACSRAVGVHRAYVPDQPIQVTLTDEGDRFAVVVTDLGPSVGSPDVDALPGANALADKLVERPAEPAAPAEPGPELLPAGFRLAVIAGLVDDLTVSPACDGLPGTSVRMSWPSGPGAAASADSPPELTGA